MTMKKRCPEDPEDIEKLDEFLFQSYGYGIYECCLWVAEEIISICPGYVGSLDRLSPNLRLAPKKQIIEAKKTINRLEKAKANLIDAVFDYYKLYWRLPKKAFDRNSDEYNDWVQFILDGLNLRQAFSYIDSVKDDLNNDLKTSLRDKIWRTCGGQVKPVYKIACIFALVFINDKGPDWKFIFHLLQWFYKNLNGTDYQKEFALPEEEPKKRLKKEFYKIMSNEKRRKDIESRKDACSLPETASHPEINVRFEVPDNYRTLYLDTMKKAILRMEREKKINHFRNQNRIEFKKSRIKILPPNDCLPLVKFPDIIEGSSRKAGAIFRDVLRLEEAAAFLGVSSSDLLEKCEKEFIPYIPPNHRQIMIFDYPNKPLNPIQEKHKKEQTELIDLDGMVTFSRRQLMEWKRGPIKKEPRKAGKIFIDKKPRPKEEPIVIELTEEDVRALKEYFDLRSI